ncbi:MAG: hypothetical protein ACYTED_10160, partial [Planctomycetota bacterium]
PAIRKASASKHLDAVNKALSMLGLVPDTSAQEERRQETTTRHQAALDKALNVLGVAREPSEEEERQQQQASAHHQQAISKALHMLGKPAPPVADRPAEVAREVALPPIEPEPPEEEAAPEEEVIPLPDLEALDAPSAREDREATESIDLATAIDVDLERPKAIPRDYAVAILNAVVLLAAAGSALYAGGIVTRDGLADGAWREFSLGAGAVLCGASALFALRMSIHLRAALAGTSALLLHALLLVLLTPRAPLSPGVAEVACGLTSLLGAALVLQTAHPLAVLMGFGIALVLPRWFAPEPAVFLPYVVAINAVTGFCALRLRRLQASVAAAVLTGVLLVPAPYAVPAAYGGVLAALYLAQVIAAPFVARRQTRVAAVLAFPALAGVAWTVHQLYQGPGWIKVGALFVLATGLGLFAIQLHRRHEILRGTLKAGAVLLLLSSLPAGLAGANLGPFALYLSLLFGVFALSLCDAYLRAVGSLTLVVAVALIVKEGPSAPLALASAVAATVLCAVRAKGANPPALRLLLGALAHASLLYGLALLVPADFLAYVWLGLALAHQVAGRKLKLLFLEAGAALTAGAAAVWVVSVQPAEPLSLAIAGAALAPHFLLVDPERSRAGEFYLLAGQLLGLAALALWVPGPLGLLGSLALLTVLYLPYGPRGTLRTHARFLTLLLLARCFLPDILAWPVAMRWANLRFAAMLACAVPALVNVRLAAEGRAVTTVLASAVVGTAVHLETGVWQVGLVAALAVAAGSWFLASAEEARTAEAVEEDETEERPEEIELAGEG